MQDSLSDKEWCNLLQDIESGRVVPVIGPSLITIQDSDAPSKLLYSVLAPLLAAELKLSSSDTYNNTADVAADFVLSGGDRGEVYRELRDLLKRHARTTASARGSGAMNDPLSQLAAIRGFSLYLGTTPDHRMRDALRQQRPGFDPERHCITFHPNEAPEERDLPTTRLRGPEVYLYQLLGDHDPKQCRDFAVWEEDLMEFICGLLEHADQLGNLFHVLKDRSLLFLGAPADDWTVRFLLRVVRRERLSTRSKGTAREYIADDAQTLRQSTVLFFDKAVHSTRVITGSPIEFVNELSNRWNQHSRDDQNNLEYLASLPVEIPTGAVFISYASEDFDVALSIARAISAEGTPIWIDRRQLQLGQLYDEKLETAVKLRCGLFVSLVSKASESHPDRYVHKERGWAAQRQGNLPEEFYIPVLVDIDSARDLRIEPEGARKRHIQNIRDTGVRALAMRIRDLHKLQRSGT